MTTHIILGDPLKAKVEAIKRNAEIARLGPLPDVIVLEGPVAWHLWDDAVRALEEPKGVVAG